MFENRLLNFYTQILALGGFSVIDKQGFINTELGDNSLPVNVKVSGHPKRMVLPTDEILKANNWSNLIPFHPLNENLFAAKGESLVLQTFRLGINYRVNIVIHCLVDNLLRLADSPGLHKKLSPEQLSVLTAIKDVDEKTIENYEAITKAIGGTNTRDNITHFFLKKQGVINGEKFSRVGTWSFPLYNEIKNSDGKVRGVKVRKRDLETYRRLYEFLIPNITDEYYWMTGSNSTMAPFTDALLRSTWKIAEPLNGITDLMFGRKTYISAEEAAQQHAYLYFNTDWLELGNDLDSLRKDVCLIPVQDTTGVEPQQPVEATPEAPSKGFSLSKPQTVAMPTLSTTTAPVAQPQTVVAQPAVNTLPVATPAVNPVVQQQPVQTGKGLSLGAVIQENQQKAMQAMQQQQALMYGMNPAMTAQFAPPMQMAQMPTMVNNAMVPGMGYIPPAMNGSRGSMFNPAVQQQMALQHQMQQMQQQQALLQQQTGFSMMPMQGLYPTYR